MPKKKFLQKKYKQAKSLVPTKVADKAAELNPLNVPDATAPSLEGVPQITNETIAEHREEVLKGARKYIYPLQQSKHRIVLITVGIIVGATTSFLIYCGLSLYKYQQYNTFIYRVTQVVPFPVGRDGGRFISYENYLFELRHYVHYYENQLQSDFSTEGYKQQLENYRKQALEDVVNLAYIKDVASQNNIRVTDKEVSDRIALVRAQNRLGSNDKVFADVLRSYWGWSVNDFRRSLKDQILTEKVVAKLDTTATKKSQEALAQVKAGADFSAVAKQFSDDPGVANNNGDYGFRISRDNPNIPATVVAAMFRLKAGEVSEVINTGNSLEIIKVVENKGDFVTAQHITINFAKPSALLENAKKSKPVDLFIKL